MPPESRKPPSQTWRTFLSNHVGSLSSIDFFTVQEQMMREIESSMPLFLVTVKTHPSRLVRPESDRTIFEWARRFAREHYELVGTVEGDDTGRARVSWSGTTVEAGPRAEILARVYRRREGIPR